MTITGSATGRVAALRLIDILADTSEETGQPIAYWLTTDLSEIPQASYLTQNNDQLVSGNFTLKGEGQLTFYLLPTIAEMKTAIRRKDKIQPTVTMSRKHLIRFKVWLLWPLSLSQSFLWSLYFGTLSVRAGLS